MLVRTSVLALDQAVRVMFDIGDGLELWLDDRRLGMRHDDRNIRLRLTGVDVPSDLVKIHVRGQIGSAVFDASYDPEPNLHFEHVWDGSSPDADSEVPGAPASSLVTDIEVGWEMAPVFPRPARTRWWTRRVTCGGADLRSLGCGGVTPTPVHRLDVAADILWRGDGSPLVGAQLQSSHTSNRLRVRADEIAVTDDKFVHVFDRDGSFLRTLSGLKGTVLTTAKADEEGRITSWVHRGHRYTIDRRNDTEALLRSPAGVWAVMDFDEQQRAIAVTDQTGTKAELQWDVGGLSGITDSTGLITKIERDEVGRVVRFVESTGRQLDLVRTEFASGSQVNVITAEGRETTHRSEEMPDGTIVDTQSCCGATNPRVIERRSLGPLGEERVVRSPDGTVSITRFGSRTDERRVTDIARTSITAPTGRTLSIERRTDSHRTGLTTEKLTVGDSTWRKRLDPTTHTTSSESPEGRKISSVLDPGKSLTMSTPRAGSLAVIYDDQQRPKQRRHNGSEVTFGYDQNGRLSWTDFERWRQQIHHDEPGRVIAIETPDGWVQFARDDAGRVVAVKTANDSVTTIRRRPDGEIETIVYPEVVPESDSTDGEGATERLAYDRDGLVVARSFGDDHHVAYERDSAGRITATTAGSVAIDAEYDEATGRLAKVATAEGDAVHFRYDGTMQYAEVARGRTPGRVERRFDENHRVVTRSVNGGHELHYGRDRDGLVKSVGPLQLERNTGGLSVATTLRGLTTTRTYDAEGRLTSHETRFGKLAKVYFSEQIERDSFGRIIEIAEHSQGVDRVVTYDYNDQRRLAEVEVNDEPVLKLTYDANGNIVELDRQGRALPMVVDASDRIVRVAGAPAHHDAAGNLVGIGEDGAVRRYRFDGLSRLVGFVDARGIEIDHSLDGFGRPVEISVAGAESPTTNFLWDGSRVAATLTDDGEVDMCFIDSGSGAAPEALIRKGVEYLLIADHLGSIRCVVNALDGEVVQTLDYDTLGRVKHNSAPGWQPFGFAGGLHEHNSGLVRFGARTYDPFLGRFLSRDPLGFAGGQINLYLYAHGDPVNYTDPSGLTTIASGEVHVCRESFIAARPLTMDHVYLLTDEWRQDMLVATSFGLPSALEDSLAHTINDLDAGCPERSPGWPEQFAAPSGQTPDASGTHAEVWGTLDSCADPSAWQYDAAAWSKDPGVLETVGRTMKLAATAKNWLPDFKSDLGRLTD